MIRSILSAFLLLFALVTNASAQSCGSYPVALTNGTNADASQVMQNFEAVRTCVNNIGPSVTGGVNAQTGTSYTVVTSDNGKIVTFSNASPVAVSLPQATGTSGSFAVGWRTCFASKGAGSVTITPVVSTLDNVATLGLDVGQSLCVTSDGTNYATDRSFGANVGEVKWIAYNRSPPNFIKANGTTYSRLAPYDRLFAKLVYSSTVTISNANPAVVTWNGHGLSAGDSIKFFNVGGSLPGGITGGTHGAGNTGAVYYVISAGLSANTFEFSATPGGTAVATTSGGSGSQTAVNAPCGDGDGATTFTVCDLRGDFVRNWDDGAGIDANRAFGLEQLDAMQGHVHSFSQTLPVLYERGSSGFAGYASGSNVDRATVSVGSPTTDGVNGTPRTAAETRPRNYSLMPIIRYQ